MTTNAPYSDNTTGTQSAGLATPGVRRLKPAGIHRHGRPEETSDATQRPRKQPDAPARIHVPISPSTPRAASWRSSATRACLCTASVENGVPRWMRGSGSSGWVTGEYGMLPRATHYALRHVKPPAASRAGEPRKYQRLIGRSLRAAMDLGALGERTVTLDCDVHAGRRRYPHRRHQRRLCRAQRWRWTGCRCEQTS